MRICANPLVDCNTVGPVSKASGYKTRTLTHFAPHVLDVSKYHASAHRTSIKEIHIQNVDSDFKELSDHNIGHPKTNSIGITASVTLEGKNSGTFLTTLTGSNLHLDRMVRYRDKTQRWKRQMISAQYRKPAVLLYEKISVYFVCYT